MQFRDVQMVNDALGNLGNTLARNRLMDEQRKEREQGLAIRQQQYDDLKEYRAGQLQNQATAENDRRQKGLERVWGDLVKMHTGWVKDGIMKPDISVKALRDSYEKLPDEAKKMLQGNPQVQAILDDNFQLQEPPEKTTAQNDTAEVKNKRYADTLREQAKQQGIAPEDAKRLNALADQFESTIGHQQRTDSVKLQRNRFVAGLIAKQNAGELDARAVRSAINAYDAQTADETNDKVLPGKPAEPATFDTEATARAAGNKAGDIVTIKGVGKVRLK